MVALSSNGERETNLDAIKQSACRLLKNHQIDIFIPAVSQTVRGESETIFYMNGYVFIKYREEIPYLKLRETTYFNDILCSFANRKIRYKLLDDVELEKIRQGVNDLKFSEFQVGDEVMVTKGNFINLPGKVSYIYSEETLQIAIVLRSKQALMDFPSTYIRKR